MHPHMQNSIVKLVEVDARIASRPFVLQWELIDVINENDA